MNSGFEQALYVKLPWVQFL